MKLPTEKIREIADALDCGMICFVNKNTLEIKSISDPNGLFYENTLWEEELEEIEHQWGDYIKLEKMSSREAFQIMEDFLDEISNKGIRERLVYALNSNRPFKNFKYEVDYDEEVRQQWFQFKAHRYQEWVKRF